MGKIRSINVQFNKTYRLLSILKSVDFMTNANEGITSNCGKRLQIVLTACRSLQLVSFNRLINSKLITDRILLFSLTSVDEKIFCCHGGLSPDLQSMEQIRRIMRPTDVPDQGLLCDLLWSDPDKDTMGWGENDRGVSFTFGAEVRVIHPLQINEHVSHESSRFRLLQSFWPSMILI